MFSSGHYPRLQPNIFSVLLMKFRSILRT
nr:unnamed protein product [Callosobruchus analis]